MNIHCITLIATVEHQRTPVDHFNIPLTNGYSHHPGYKKTVDNNLMIVSDWFYYQIS